MGADSTAAAYLMDRQKAFDPMGAFAAGVQLQSNLQKISLAGQASQIDTILNVVKMQNEQADQRRKDELTKQQLSIASYNAETNRINANRPRTTAATQTGGGLGSILGVDENGLYLKGPEEAQGPTEGQGDGPEVQTPSGGSMNNSSAQPGGNDLGSHIPGYDPFGANALTANQQVQKQQAEQSGGSLLPGGGAMQATDPSMAGPVMPGAPQRPPQPKGRTYFDIDSIGINAKGQPTMSLKRRGAGKDELPPIPTGPQLAALSAPYAHLGLQAVPDAENKRGYTFKEIPKMTGHDLSISTLPAETQKGFIEDVNAMIKLGGNTDGPSDVEKMEAMGVTVEKDSDGVPTAAGLQKAGQEMATKGLSWREGFNRAQAKKDNDLIAKAAVYANKLNAEMHGKQGWQTKTALDVINDIGLKPPASIISQQLAAAPGGRTVSVAASGQDQAAGAPATGVASVGGVRAAAQPAPSNGREQIAQLEQEIPFLPQGPERQQKTAFLESLRKQQSSAPSAPVGAVKPTGDPIVDEVNRAKMLKEAKAKASGSGQDAKQMEENQKWDASKFKLLKALNDTNTTTDEVGFIAPVGGEVLSKGGVSYGMTQWFEKNKDKLDFKPLDGKPLSLDSPVFKTNDGREVKLKEVYQAMLKDPRIGGSPRQDALKQGATQLTEAEKALLGK